LTPWADRTVAELRAHLRDHAQDGTRCAGCGRHYKIYRRPLNAIMARALSKLYNLSIVRGEGWVHAQQRGAWPSGGEMAKLRFWGLIEERAPNTDTTKRSSGWWRPTPLGVQFVLRQVCVAKYVSLLNNEPVGFSTGKYEPAEYIMIDDALADRFDYNALMNGGA